MSFIALSRDELSIIVDMMQRDRIEDSYISNLSLISKDISRKMLDIPFRKHIIWDGERSMQFVRQSHQHLRTLDKITIYDTVCPCVWITIDWPREVVFHRCDIDNEIIEATGDRGKNVESLTIFDTNRKSRIKINIHTFPNLKYLNRIHIRPS